MSTWKKAAKTCQKTHRERHQLDSRQHLGLLEKKKDYVARARDYNEKKKTLKLLRQKALNKNPDEFYFHMINSQVQDGVHREKQKEEEHTPDQLKLMETQDMKYISYRRNLEARKIDKLQSNLHLIDEANKVKNKHIFFTDDEEKLKKTDIAKRLNTHPAFLGRRTNRPTLETLKSMSLPDLDESALAKIEQQKQMAYRELEKRLEREKELKIVMRKMEIQRALKDKKMMRPKKVKKGTPGNAPVYQWKYERKR